MNSKVIDAFRALLNTEDDTGCNGGLTVVSKQALQQLEEALHAAMTEQRPSAGAVVVFKIDPITWIHERVDLELREEADSQNVSLRLPYLNNKVQYLREKWRGDNDRAGLLHTLEFHILPGLARLRPDLVTEVDRGRKDTRTGF